MNNIEKRRQKVGMTQKELCCKVGICLKTYYLYAISDNPKPIPSDKLLLFSEHLQCSTDYLLGLPKPVLEEISTKLIIDELSNRIGVEKTIAEPYENICVNIDGPAIVLIVTD